MTGQVTISKEKYANLLMAEAKMDMLEEGGISDFDVYEEILYPHGEETIEDKEEDIIFRVERM